MPKAAAGLLDDAVRTYAGTGCASSRARRSSSVPGCCCWWTPGEAADRRPSGGPGVQRPGQNDVGARAEALAFEADVRRRLDAPGTRSTRWWVARVTGRPTSRRGSPNAGWPPSAATSRCTARWRRSGRPAPGRSGCRRRPGDRGADREPAAARGGARPRRVAARAAAPRRWSGSAAGWQTCTPGSRRTAASTCRAPWSGHGRSLAKLGLDQAVEDGRPAVVHEWSERARALVARVPPVRPPADPERGRPTDRAADAARRGSPAEERARLRERVREDAWYRPGAGTVLEPLDLDEVRGRLGDDALVSYLIAHGKLHALVVTSDDARCSASRPRSGRRLLPGLAADLDMVAVSDLPPGDPRGRDQRPRRPARRASRSVLVAPLRGAARGPEARGRPGGHGWPGCRGRCCPVWSAGR